MGKARAGRPSRRSDGENTSVPREKDPLSSRKPRHSAPRHARRSSHRRRLPVLPLALAGCLAALGLKSPRATTGSTSVRRPRRRRPRMRRRPRPHPPVPSPPKGPPRARQPRRRQTRPPEPRRTQRRPLLPLTPRHPPTPDDCRRRSAACHRGRRQQRGPAADACGQPELHASGAATSSVRSRPRHPLRAQRHRRRGRLP